MGRRNILDEEYCDNLKRDSIMCFIFDSDNEFDYVDLADHMGMTFKQLQDYLIKMEKKGELDIDNGMIRINHDMFRFVLEKEMQDLEEYVIIQDVKEYIPINFHKKFKGYT